MTDPQPKAPGVLPWSVFVLLLNELKHSLTKEKYAELESELYWTLS